MPDLRRQPRPAIIKNNVALIPLGVGAKHGHAIVDIDMAWLADKYKWTLDTRKRYASTGTYKLPSGRNGSMYLHRAVAGVNAGGIVDHISRDTLDNRRCNLRIVDHKINTINSANRGDTSKYRGVCWDHNRKKWKSGIKNNGVYTTLGRFNSEVQAARVYNVAALKAFGEHAVLNDV